MDNDLIHDMFESLGAVTIKRMFGGKGIYHQGRILALEVDGEILLKADAETAPAFAAAGSAQWVYEGKNKPVAMPYWSIPTPPSMIGMSSPAGCGWPGRRR